jgi:hypothetical protein
VRARDIETLFRSDIIEGSPEKASQARATAYEVDVTDLAVVSAGTGDQIDRRPTRRPS